jgi:hypothetical protein
MHARQDELQPGFFALSIVIAIVAATAAPWFALRSCILVRLSAPR